MADEGEAAADTAAPTPAPGADRAPDRAVDGAVDGAVDVVVAVVLLATWVTWFRWTQDGWFFLDEWALAGRGRTLGDFLEPYNNHLSVPYLAVYRAHMALFGFDRYEVLRAIGHTALV